MNKDDEYCLEIWRLITSKFFGELITNNLIVEIHCFLNDKHGIYLTNDEIKDIVVYHTQRSI